MTVRFPQGFRNILPVPINLGLIKAFQTFVSSIISTKVLNRPSKRGPLFVTWLVTHECNVFCRFCSTHNLKKQFPEAISPERARKIAYEIIRAKTYAVGFTGGEVLLWPHLFDVIKILKKHGVVVYIVTNGLLLREKADEILESRLDYVVVSIDSDDAGEHDRLRDCPGLYEKLAEGIRYLKTRRKGETPLIKAATIICRSNLPVLERIVDNLKSLVDVTSVQPIVGGYAHGPHGRSETHLEPLMFRSDEEDFVRGFFDKWVRHSHDFRNDYFRLIPRYWFHKEELAAKINCWSPFLRLQILPNGDVFHCTANAKFPSVGNLNHSSLGEIWNSAEMIRQREEIRFHRNGCICWAQDTSFNAFLGKVPCPKIASRFVRQCAQPQK